MNEALGKTPALWLSHPETSKHEGTTEGVKTYAVRMFIIGMPDRQSAADPELVWAAMEAEAAKICEAIADAECVKSISDVEMAVAKSSVTNRGEISMSIKMKVQAPFTNPKN